MLCLNTTFFDYHLGTAFFYSLLMKKEVIWSKAFVMIIVHCKIPSKHRTYAGLIYIQFRLFVKVKRTNIFHKYSQCCTVQCPSSSSSIQCKRNCIFLISTKQTYIIVTQLKHSPSLLLEILEVLSLDSFLARLWFLTGFPFFRSFYLLSLPILQYSSNVNHFCKKLFTLKVKHFCIIKS